MNIRRAILFTAPAFLYALCIAFVTMWILEIKAHSAFTDLAAPFLAASLFLAFPVAVVTMWLTGRKGEFRRFDKLIAWVSIVPVLIPWGFVCVISLALLSW